MNALKSPYAPIALSTIVGGISDYRNGMDIESYGFMTNRGVDIVAASTATVGGLYVTASWTAGMTEAGFLAGKNVGWWGAGIGIGAGLLIGVYMDNWASPEIKQLIHQKMSDFGIMPNSKPVEPTFLPELWVPGSTRPPHFPDYT